MTHYHDDQATEAADAHDAAAFDPGKPKAPESPKIRAWNRRILQFGCLPMMIAGFLAAFRMPYVVEIGTLMALLIGVPIAAYTIYMRRSNQSAYEAALAKAEETGMRVRTVETASGDNEYVLEEREVIEPLEPIEPIEPPGSIPIVGPSDLSDSDAGSRSDSSSDLDS